MSSAYFYLFSLVNQQILVEFYLLIYQKAFNIISYFQKQLILTKILIINKPTDFQFKQLFQKSNFIQFYILQIFTIIQVYNFNYKMKFLSKIILALITICLINAQDSQEGKKVLNCLQQIENKNPCQIDDKDCMSELSKFDRCTQQCVIAIAGETFGQLKYCILSNCTTNDQNVQILIDESIKCIHSSILQTAFIIFIILNIIF
ncbi:transmembrane protein, putative (macronuclear) [Tetrahymena thermophila SB210]|uniref:Transmembrane protein, putative n=1 Tax=Tetrahymena thermophila (strain SB210) TaxID=312017 RepID=Q23NF9_TETTS|nr:transmembrane protein, putative [Tetrahymena thermophila SB210]EAR98115.2 transmembrane protein, putative [Tetrahymena thermophila SB210]|eukprot:XP_001018360.2 transmembrane protein, putative [Tetrahymena thermophila SB210]